MIALYADYTSTYTWFHVLKVEAPQASVLTYTAKNATHENIDTDTSDSDTADSSDEETPAKKVFNCCTMQFMFCYLSSHDYIMYRLH